MILHQRYTDVKNGKATKEQFLQEAKWDPILSKYITNFDTFESAVNIFKTKGLLFEASDVKNNSFSVKDWRNENTAFLDTKKGDVDSAHVNLFEFEKGWRYELKLSGKCDEEAVNKAKAKAVKNLEKDAIHYTKLEMGELAPDDSGREMVDVSKGQNKVDEKGAAKPVKVKDVDTDAVAKEYLKKSEEKGKAPKKVELNEGLKLPSNVISKIEQAKDWISKKTVQDKNAPKYKAALKKLEDVLSTDAEGFVKALKGNIEKISPEFPNQKSGADFRSRLNDIYAVYESINQANLLDEKDEDYIPAVVANPIIEAMRAYVAFVRDNDLSDSYKYLKEDATVAAGVNGVSSLLQKVTGINLGASQPVSNLKDAIEQVGGGDFAKGLSNMKDLFKGNGGGTPDQQIDLLKGLVEKGAKEGSKLADIFDKAKDTFGSAKEGQKLFSISGPDRELTTTAVKKLVKAADSVSPETTADVTDGLATIAQNILQPIGITVAIGAVLWGATELKKRNDSRFADLNKLYKKLQPLTDREEGDSVPQDKKDAEDNKDTKADDKGGEDTISKPIELNPELPADAKADEPQAKDGEEAKPDSGNSASVKVEPFTADSYKDKPGVKVVGIEINSSVDGDTTKFKTVKFGLSDKVYNAYTKGSAAQKTKLNNALALIASKVKSTSTELNVDLSGMGVKEIEAASKGDAKITKAGKLKESIEIVYEASELSNMVQSHDNDKNPLVNESDCSSDPTNKLVGGLGDKMSASDVDADELAMGLAVEGEHTEDPEVAMEIALDHLTEDPNYYSKLKGAGLEEGAPGKLYRTNFPFYIVQSEKAIIAGFDTRSEAMNFFRDNAGKSLAIKTKQELAKMPARLNYDKPQNWRNISTNKFMWDSSMKEGLAKLTEVLRGMVKKSLLKESLTLNEQTFQPNTKKLPGINYNKLYKEGEKNLFEYLEYTEGKDYVYLGQFKIFDLYIAIYGDHQEVNVLSVESNEPGDYISGMVNIPAVPSLEEAFRRALKLGIVKAEEFPEYKLYENSKLKEYSFMPQPAGPDVDRKNLKTLLAGIDWPAVGQADEFDNGYRNQITQQQTAKIKTLIDAMGQEGIDIYNEYAPEGCKWGQKDELFNEQEEAENVIRQEIKDMEDLDPKDLAKEVLGKGYPEGSVKNKAAALILGHAMKDGEKDEQVKKAFMMLSDKLKK